MQTTVIVNVRICHLLQYNNSVFTMQQKGKTKYNKEKKHKQTNKQNKEKPNK